MVSQDVVRDHPGRFYSYLQLIDFPAISLTLDICGGLGGNWGDSEVRPGDGGWREHGRPKAVWVRPPRKGAALTPQALASCQRPCSIRGWLQPAALARPQLDAIRGQFVAAGERAVRFGLDMLELHRFHGVGERTA